MSKAPLKDLWNQLARGCVSLLSCQNGTRERRSCGREFAGKTQTREHRNAGRVRFVFERDWTGLTYSCGEAERQTSTVVFAGPRVKGSLATLVPWPSEVYRACGEDRGGILVFVSEK